MGCTELGLLIRQSDVSVPLFDTTVIHAKKAVQIALEDNGHVYAYVLNKDETVVQIADIDGTIACESV